MHDKRHWTSPEVSLFSIEFLPLAGEACKTHARTLFYCAPFLHLVHFSLWWQCRAPLWDFRCEPLSVFLAILWPFIFLLSASSVDCLFFLHRSGASWWSVFLSVLPRANELFSCFMLSSLVALIASSFQSILCSLTSLLRAMLEIDISCHHFLLVRCRGGRVNSGEKTNPSTLQSTGDEDVAVYCAAFADKSGKNETERWIWTNKERLYLNRRSMVQEQE